MRNFFKTICIVSVLISGSALAADPVILDQVPTPPESDGIGIWGAIAYSQVDQKRGIFWGADTRQEAEDTAMKHCLSVSGTDCSIVQTFRNHRHINDDDGTFPYNYCAVLAVNEQSGDFGVASATTLKGAKQNAMNECGASTCKIVEKGCT